MNELITVVNGTKPNFDVSKFVFPIPAMEQSMTSAIRTLIKLAAIIAWLLFLRVIGRRPCWPFK